MSAVVITDMQCVIDKCLLNPKSSAALQVPPVVLGYKVDDGRPPSVSVYITLQPRLAPIDTDDQL